MSIQSEIDRIKKNVDDTLGIIGDTGVTVGAGSDALPAAARALATEKQDKLTGNQGQVVGFDASGEAVAQDAPGVKSFNDRIGSVIPQSGDYTAEQVGAVPITGGTMTGALTAAADGSPTTAKVRNTSLNASETTPTVNGQIAWTYE